MGALVRTAFVVVGLFVLACWGPPLFGQSLNPVPLINDPLVPTSVAPGGSGFTLTLNGTGFVSASVVNWNGSPLATHFVTSSQLTATVPAANIAVAGTAAIAVSNPAPGGGTSSVAYFSITGTASSLAFTSFQSVSSSQGLLLNQSQPVTGDFNGDGKLDVAIPLNTGVGIMLGNGDGTFSQPNIIGIGATVIPVYAALAVGDFNEDGKLDLAYGDNNGDFRILLGNGDGTFQSTNQADLVFETVVTGDFNHDGKLDLAVVSQSNTSVEILLGNGDGTFQAPLTVGAAPGAPFYEGLAGIAVGDFNGDGQLDLAVGVAIFTGEFGHPPPPVDLGVSILLGNGDGTFQLTATGLDSSNAIAAMATADFNHDGKLDLLVGQWVLLGNGDGTFQSPVVVPTAGLPPFVIGDFNADGNLDIAWSSESAAGVFNGVSITAGKGDGTFQNFIGPFGIGQANVLAPVSGDFNGDGKLDFLTVSSVDQDGVGNFTVTTLLQGAFPFFLSAPISLTFANETVGTTSAAQTITITNGGQVAATIPSSGIGIVGPGAGAFSQTSNCISSLAPNASCQINVTFAPTTVGTYSASLTLRDNTPAGPGLTISLTGNTLAPPPAPAVSLSPSTVTFPAQYVGTSGLPQTVTVTNTGNATLNITGAAASSADFGVLSNCSNPVAVGSTCTIGVFFDPTAGGTRTGTLKITDNAGDSPQSVTLTGSGKDFSMTPSSSSATVSAGQTATYSIAVAPAGGFAASVALSCSGGPAGSACTVSPSTIALSGAAAQTAMVTVTTPAHGWLLPFRGGWPQETRHSQRPMILALAALFLLMVVASQFLRREQNLAWIRVAGFAALITLGLTLTSCGGGSGSGGGTNPQTYTINVTGNFTTGSTTLNHSTQLTLVVQ